MKKKDTVIEKEAEIETQAAIANDAAAEPAPLTEAEIEKLEKKQKRLQLIRWVIIKLSGMLFAVYAAYNVFSLIKDRDTILTSEGILITGAVAVLFAVLAVFAWTFGVKNIIIQMIRRRVLIITMLAITGLKLRIVDKIIGYLDLSSPETIINSAAYFMTLAGMLFLFAYYAFIIKDRPLYPTTSVVLPLLAFISFLTGLVLETILLFGYGIGVEASGLRTLVMRPVFYFGFLGLSGYFLFPPQKTDEEIEDAMEMQEMQERGEIPESPLL